MPKTYYVETTELEDKALRWAELDPQKWLEILVHHRAKCAIRELYSIELKKALEDPNTEKISSDMEAVVLASTEPTAAQKQQEMVKTVVAPAIDADPETLARHAAEIGKLTTPKYVAETPRSFLGGIE